MYFRQGENNILKDRSASEHCNEGCGLWAAEQPPPSKAGMAPCSHLSKPGAAWSQGLPQACCTAAGPWAVQHFSYAGTFWTNRGG